MGAGAGQRGGMPQSTPRSVPQAMLRSMPQMGQMPPGAPTQSGLGALAARMQQAGQMDPGMMAMMQRLQGGNVPQPAMPMGGQMPTDPQMMDQMRMGNFTRPNMPPMETPMGSPDTAPFGGMPTQQTQQAMMDQMRQANPGVGQPQMPMPQMPGMAAPGGGLLPGAQRPLPVGAGGKGAGMPRPGVPSTMVNPPRPGMTNPRGQAAQPVDPRLAMMMRGRMR